MRKEFFINIIFLIVINLLIKPFYLFGIDLQVQNTVAEGTYGLYFALFNFTFLFQIINDFGIQNYNNRNISQHNHLLDKYFPNILILKLLLAAVYLLLVFLTAILAGYSFVYFELLLFIGINHILLSLILFLRSNISGLALYRTDSLISVLDRLLLIIICGVLLSVEPYRSNFRIEWFVYAQTTTLLLTATAAFLIVYKRLKRFKLRFDLAFLLVILRRSYPYALAVFLMTIYTRIDGVMIERMLVNGKLEADYYASAYRLLDACNMIGFLFAGLLLPMFSRMIKERESVADLVRFSFQFIWAGAIPLTIATFFFQEEIMTLLYKNGGAYSGAILGFLITSFLAVSGSYIYGTLLAANDSLKQMNIIYIISVFLNVSLNLWLISTHKALGAAMATCLTQFLVFFAQILLAKKELKLGVRIDMILRMLFFFALQLMLTYAMMSFLAAPWLVKFLASISCGLLFSFIFRLIDLRQLQLLFSKTK
ncbi:MAG: oligosaccharide flippase family protein [Bacteroidota bacterium]